MNSQLIFPRSYQTECVNSFWDFFLNGNTGCPIAALPTGTGKSLIPPLFIQRAFEAAPATRCVMMTHVKELVDQNKRALLKVMPTAPVGIYSAGLGLKEAGNPIVYGSIQSIKNNVAALGRRDFMWIDEAHLLSPRDGTMYQYVIEELRRINPGMPVLGLSATCFRMGQGMLTDSTFDKDGNKKPSIFTDMVFDITGVAAFNRLIDERYLSPLVPKETDIVIDVSDVRILNGEFVQSDVESIVKKQNITARALEQAYYLLADRKSLLVFGAGIENCLQITELLNKMGVLTCCVHSKMDGDKRDAYIQNFKAGKFRAIVSNDILTTGFDHPPIDGIIDLRPTVSAAKHVQKYGRGTRPYFHPMYTYEHLRHLEHRIAAIEAGGKPNCKVLDFAGNTARLGPINDPVIPQPKKRPGTGEVPIKICPECGAYNHTPAKFCCDPDCDYEFPFRSKIKPEASTHELIRSNELSIEILPVTQMFAYHNPGKNGKSDTLRVQYFCGMRSITAWFGFGEGTSGFFKKKSHDWWRQHSPHDPPQSVSEALERFSECRKTHKLKVDTSGKYGEILEYLF